MAVDGVVRGYAVGLGADEEELVVRMREDAQAVRAVVWQVGDDGAVLGVAGLQGAGGGVPLCGVLVPVCWRC